VGRLQHRWRSDQEHCGESGVHVCRLRLGLGGTLAGAPIHIQTFLLSSYFFDDTKYIRKVILPSIMLQQRPHMRSGD
jgi:hypothetical protein